MKRTRNLLLTQLIVTIVAAVAIVILCETGVLTLRHWAQGITTEFIVTTVMELLTLLVVWMGLRLFHLSRIRKKLATGQAQALLKWGTLRIQMLCLPLLANTLLYYIYMNVAFGYMAIIILLSLLLVYPSMRRCQAEIEIPETDTP